jgi:O-methyltransferase/aklanonic acid methyltransferase
MENRVIDLFDRVAGSYDEVLPFFASFARELTAPLPLAAGARVLDVGAGRGAVTRELLARGCEVTAVDAAPGMVRHLAADFPGAAVSEQDAQRLDLPGGTFDAVLSAFVVHLLDDAAAAVAEARRVLRPGGTYTFCVPGPPEGFEPPPVSGPKDPLRRLTAEYAQFVPAGSGRMGRDLDGVALLESAGFTEIEVRGIVVDLPVPDGETYWQWGLSHGSLAFYEGLPGDRREELRRRLVAEVDALPGLRLRRDATVWTARA